jgi:hypothetical protein
MAERAYERARRWTDRSTKDTKEHEGGLPGGAPTAGRVLGVACTATLATNYPKRGDHRVVVAVRDAEGVKTHSLILTKGARDRAGEEEVVSRLVLRALSEACGVSPAFEVGLLSGETVAVEREERAAPITRLLRGDFEWLLVLPDGQMVPSGRLEAAILPGAFNPLHAGHRRLAAVAARRLDRTVAYELSVENVDKPPLSESEVRRRLRQFAWHAPVLLTRAPTFRRKSELFPGAAFVIGYDTLERLFVPRYYGGEAEMRAALAAIAAAGVQFLVAGRRDEDRFRTLDDFPLPDDLRSLFTGIPEAEFRSDLSSTAIRAVRGAKPDARPPELSPRKCEGSEGTKHSESPRRHGGTEAHGAGAESRAPKPAGRQRSQG